MRLTVESYIRRLEQTEKALLHLFDACKNQSGLPSALLNHAHRDIALDTIVQALGSESLSIDTAKANKVDSSPNDYSIPSSPEQSESNIAELTLSTSPEDMSLASFHPTTPIHFDHSHNVAPQAINNFEHSFITRNNPQLAETTTMNQMIMLKNLQPPAYAMQMFQNQFPWFEAYGWDTRSTGVENYVRF